jgi:acyl dehydratase
MPRFHFEDFRAGDVRIYGPRRVTRAEIIAFAAEFDPQPMHMDEAAGSVSLLGGLAASGWHACAIMMRMIADAFILESTSMGGPGVEEVRWRKPLRPDTAVRVRATVLETRASGSRPGIGYVKFRFELIDVADVVIAEMVPMMMFGRTPQQAA